MIEPIIVHDYEVLQATRRAELLAELEPQVRGHREFTLEIGAGHGHFLAAYAAAHPDRFCVGIDIMSDRVRRGLRKRDRAGLANLAFLHADAGDFMAVLPDGVSLAEVFVLFPDPWPKRRHWKNRLIQPSFLEILARRAPAGAPLYFRTDYEPYFEEALAAIDSHADWQLSQETAWPFEHVTVFQARAPSHQSLVALRREPGAGAAGRTGSAAPDNERTETRPATAEAADSPRKASPARSSGASLERRPAGGG